MPPADPHSSGSSGKETNTSCLQKLGINSAELEGAGDAVDGQHIGRNAIVDLVHLREAHYFIEGIVHDVEEALVYFALAPEETLAILDPLEITDRDSPGVAENIRYRKDAFGVDNRVGLPGGGAVGAFAKNLGLHLLGIFFGDLIFDGRRNGDLAGLKENIARRHFCSPTGEILKRLLLRVHPVDDLRHVKTFFIVKCAADVREADNLVARFFHEFPGHGTDVAEALNHDAAAWFLDSQLGERLVAANHHPAAGGFFPAARAAEFDRLAGHNGCGGLTDVHRVRVHDPSHGLFVSADVGRWDVALRTQPIGQFRGIAASKPLELSSGHLPRIANHSALRAAKGNIYYRAFPRHPSGQRAHFVD